MVVVDFNDKEKTSMIGNLLWIMRMLLRHNAGYVLITIIITIINGIVPVVSLIIMQQIVNFIQVEVKNLDRLILFVTIYIGIELLKNLITSIFSYIDKKANQEFALVLTRKILVKVSKLRLIDYENSSTYDSINRAQNEGGEKLISYYQKYLKIMQDIITLGSYLSVLFFFELWIVFVIISVPCIRFVINRKFNEKMFQIIQKRTNDSRKLWYFTYLLTYGFAFKELKTYNLFDYFIQEYSKLKNRFNHQDLKLFKKYTILNCILNVIEALIDGVLFFYIILMGFNKIILIGNVITYTRTVIQGKSLITNILLSITSLYQESLFIDQVTKLMNLPEENENHKLKIDEVKSIELKNVSFSYGNSKKEAVRNINIKLDKNKKIALVGRNGSGKTTLIKLVLGLYDSYEGKILINNIELENIDKKTYHKKISVVFQDYVQYEATMKENIQLGDIDKPFNEQYLDTVCKDIGIQKIINSFTKGINTQLGHWFDNGTNISTGQWQKIALARAAYRNGDIFIFDEPNAALDKISEQDFIRFYKERCQDKIGIIISHKIDDSVKMADEILVLQDGEIVERGNYQHLLKNGTVFRKFLI